MRGLLTTNLGVRSSNLFGRANYFNGLVSNSASRLAVGVPLGFQLARRNAHARVGRKYVCLLPSRLACAIFRHHMYQKCRSAPSAPAQERWSARSFMQPPQAQRVLSLHTGGRTRRSDRNPVAPEVLLSTPANCNIRAHGNRRCSWCGLRTRPPPYRHARRRPD